MDVLVVSSFSSAFRCCFSLCLKTGYKLSFCRSAGREFQSLVLIYVTLFLNVSVFGFLVDMSFFLLLRVVILLCFGFQLLKLLSLVDWKTSCPKCCFLLHISFLSLASVCSKSVPNNLSFPRAHFSPWFWSFCFFFSCLG